jgi:hypothetical protein
MKAHPQPTEGGKKTSPPSVGSLIAFHPSGRPVALFNNNEDLGLRPNPPRDAVPWNPFDLSHIYFSAARENKYNK